VIDLIKAAGRKAFALPGDIREEAFCQKLVNDAVNGLAASISWFAMQDDNKATIPFSILLPSNSIGP
jgi:hypothetical protein